jgi:hypothetical protein
MRLFGASIVETVDSFLHVGYMSAYPRPLEPDAYPIGSGDSASAAIAHELDMVEALRLGEPADAGDLLDASVGVVTGGGGHEMLLLWALTLTGLAALLYLMRRYTSDQRLRLAPIAALAFLTMLLSIPHCKDDKSLLFDDENLPSDAPWEGEVIRSYVHPEEATVALLNGIVAPALANIGQKVASLANIQEEVALPVRTLSEGQAYALKTYGIDGFGNLMRLEKDVDEKSYTVTSAGRDGVHGTDDDISVKVAQNVNDSWGWAAQPAYYLVNHDGQVQVLYHRWKHEMFDYNDKALAEEITGSVKYDVLVRLNAAQQTAIDTSYSSIAAKADGAPLVLQVFSPGT